MRTLALRHVAIALLSAVLALLATAPGGAKGRVVAHLLTPVAVDAEPGTSLELAWKLRSPHPGGSHAFGARDIFVELRDAGGGMTSVGRATGAGGRYRARVSVPAAGIGGIAIGLEGTRYVGGAPGSASAVATHAPMFFEIGNDPLAGGRTLAEDDPAAPLWPWLLAGFAAIAALLAAARRITVQRAVT